MAVSSSRCQLDDISAARSMYCHTNVRITAAMLVLSAICRLTETWKQQACLVPMGQEEECIRRIASLQALAVDAVQVVLVVESGCIAVVEGFMQACQLVQRYACHCTTSFVTPALLLHLTS